MTDPKLKIYFDGLCHLCSREINHYRKQRGSDAMEFIDITASQFNAAGEGLDPIQVHREMHVRRADRTLAVGLDAFIAIWECLPRYRFAAKLASRPVPHSLLSFGYKVFSRIRPYLPRKKSECADSPYCDVSKGGNQGGPV